MESHCFHLANEFAAVRVCVDRDANGPRLEIVDLSTGTTVYLDPLELQSLAWVRHRDLGAIVAPAYRESVAVPKVPDQNDHNHQAPQPRLVWDVSAS